jgi:acetylornithine deacetylase/succinyl-diaminopimelate desuccinylase-like protein
MTLDQYMAKEQDRLLAELVDFLRIPSISTDRERARDTARAAEFVASSLRRLGFDVIVHPTPGHPVVTARGPHVPDAPTVLIYGHYDVQPVDPIELWSGDPFDPRVVDGAIVARGASDDKGQAYAHVKGVEALLAVDGRLPVNVTFVLEGEEEIGSPNLLPLIEAQRERLRADVALVSDGAMAAPSTPTITYGLRGMVYVTVRVRGAGHDLHSGAYGGGVPNALGALATILAGLKDEGGRVSVPGFYDDVVDLDERERRQLAAVPFSEVSFKEAGRVRATPGEVGYSLLERITARPTLDVNGLSGGFQGAGSKTVIAAEGMAKVSCRLVPNQDPHDILAKLTAHVERLAPDGVDVTVDLEAVGEPAMTDLASPVVQVAGEALRQVWGRDPVFARTGGSIPIVSAFKRVLGADPVLVGLGQEDDGAHSPNEKFDVVNYLQGVRVSAELLRAFARLPR